MARKKSAKKPDSPPVGRPVALPWSGLDFQTGWRRWLVVVLALIVALAFLYPEPMFEGKVFQSADSGNADAFAAVGDASLQEGHYPLWNPYLFAGMPTFGSVAYVKYLYPPSLIFNFLQGTLGFPPLTWMLGHMLFGGLGMAWLLSRWKLPLGAVVLGALVFLLFPRVVAWGVHGHGTKLGAAMYLPWILGWALRVTDGYGWRAVGMTGLLLGLQLLRGHPQISYYTLLAVGWLVLWVTIFPAEEWTKNLSAKLRWRRLGLVLIGLGLGFAISAIMLLPVHAYSGISIRGQDTEGGGGVGLDYATAWSLAPAELSTTILPAAAGFGQATYLGMMPFTDYPNYFGLLLLLLAGAAGWSRQRSWFLGLLGLAFLALLVSLGNFGFGLYEWLYAYLPFFNKFRVPSMILLLVALALAILAARGVGAWAARQSAPAAESSIPYRDEKVLPGILALAGAVLLVMGMSGAGKAGYLSTLQDLAASSGKQAVDVLLQEAWFLHKSSLIRIGLLLLTAGAALWASVRQPNRMGPVLPWVLVVLVAMDLGGVNRLVVHPERGLHAVARDSQGRGQLVRAAPLLRKLPGAVETSGGPAAAQISALVGHGRLWPLGSYSAGNFWMTDGIRSLGGYHPAKLASFEKIRLRLFNNQPAGHLVNWLAGNTLAFERLLGAEELAYINQFGTEVGPSTGRTQAPYLYPNQAALPRARLMSAWRSLDEFRAELPAELPQKDALNHFLDGLQGGSIDYRQVVHLDEQPDPLPVSGESVLPEPVFLEDGLDEVVLRVETPRAALLLLADMNAPGWQVEVDGQEKTLLTADLVLRAVALEAGTHEVRFHYSDPSVARGLAISLVGLAVTLALVLGPGLLRKWRPSARPEVEHG